MSDFFVPDHVEDIPPPHAAAVERARARALAWLSDNDYHLVVPPLVEYLQTLTAGDEALDFQTFKITDTLSGRTLGIRADQTPQIARFDAGVGNGGRRRYCYCGPTLRTHPPLPWQSRESMQLGAELFGAPAPAGDWEIVRVALGCLQAVGLDSPRLDLGHAGLFVHLTAGISLQHKKDLVSCLARRDIAGIRRLSDAGAGTTADAEALVAVAEIHGEPAAAMTAARERLPADKTAAALDELAYVARQLQSEGFDVAINLSDAGSYGYHTGMVFSAYIDRCVALRGGRYSHEGADATGFSTDLRLIADRLAENDTAAAVAVPMRGDDPAWREAVSALRATHRRIRFVYEGDAMTMPLLRKQGASWELVEA